MYTGEYFGERALLTEDNRAANVIAASDMVNVLMLDRLAFNSLLGSLSEVSLLKSKFYAFDILVRAGYDSLSFLVKRCFVLLFRLS